MYNQKTNTKQVRNIRKNIAKRIKRAIGHRQMKKMRMSDPEGLDKAIREMYNRY